MMSKYLALKCESSVTPFQVLQYSRRNINHSCTAPFRTGAKYKHINVANRSILYYYLEDVGDIVVLFFNCTLIVMVDLCHVFAMHMFWYCKIVSTPQCCSSDGDTFVKLRIMEDLPIKEGKWRAGGAPPVARDHVLIPVPRRGDTGVVRGPGRWLQMETLGDQVHHCLYGVCVPWRTLNVV